VTEFGGMRLGDTGGCGYLDARSDDQFVESYADLIGALVRSLAVQGFCYTQLTDVEQEQNGLAAYDRTPKVDPERIRPLTRMPTAEP
jgi:hypothetical protein